MPFLLLQCVIVVKKIIGKTSWFIVITNYCNFTLIFSPAASFGLLQYFSCYKVWSFSTLWSWLFLLFHIFSQWQPQTSSLLLYLIHALILYSEEEAESGLVFHPVFVDIAVLNRPVYDLVFAQVCELPQSFYHSYPNDNNDCSKSIYQSLFNGYLSTPSISLSFFQDLCKHIGLCRVLQPPMCPALHRPSQGGPRNCTLGCC